MKKLKLVSDINGGAIAQKLPRNIWTESTDTSQFMSDFIFLQRKFLFRTKLMNHLGSDILRLHFGPLALGLNPAI